MPSPQNPQSLNRYAYVYNNPPKHIDPTGHCSTNDWKCQSYLYELQKQFGIVIDDKNQLWTLVALQEISAGIQALVAQLEGGIDRFKQIFGGTRFTREDKWTAKVTPDPDNPTKFYIKYTGGKAEGSTITFYNDQFADYGIMAAAENTVHELGHVWDNRAGDNLSKGIARATGSTQWSILGIDLYHDCKGNTTWYGQTRDEEDWAEALSMTIFFPAGISKERKAYVINILRPSQRSFGGR